MKSFEKLPCCHLQVNPRTTLSSSNGYPEESPPKNTNLAKLQNFDVTEKTDARFGSSDEKN